MVRPFGLLHANDIHGPRLLIRVTYTRPFLVSMQIWINADEMLELIVSARKILARTTTM